jgi:drug/metabolite transporter (DMT)-like permease
MLPMGELISEMKSILYLCAAAFALLFGVGGLIGTRRSPLWLRWSCIFIGIAGIAGASLGFALNYNRRSLGYTTRVYLDHYATLFAGVAIGALVVLGIYGLVSSLMSRHHNRTDRNPRSERRTEGP